MTRRLGLLATAMVIALMGTMAVLSYVHRVEASTVAGADFNSGTASAGWTCLKFSMQEPQYYQYNYTATPGKDFAAVAKGDLDGDGTDFSTFTLNAVVRNGTVVVAPALAESNPDE